MILAVFLFLRTVTTTTTVSRVTDDYAAGLAAVLTAVEGIAPRDAALRVVGMYNSVIGHPGWDSTQAVAPSVAGTAAFVAAQRVAAEQHGATFVDMLRRILGSGLELELRPAEALPPIVALGSEELKRRVALKTMLAPPGAAVSRSRSAGVRTSRQRIRSRTSVPRRASTSSTRSA